MEIKAPFEKLLGLTILEARRDFARIMMPYRAELTNPSGVIHGGAISSLADTSIAIALGTVYSHGGFYTAEFEIQFKAPARNDLFAEAHIIRKKLNLYIYHVEVTDTENKLIAVASGKYLVPKSGKPR